MKSVATNIHTDLIVRAGDELSSLLSGSVLGASTQRHDEEAAGASTSGSVAPSGSSAPEAGRGI
jgi:hypothetical protein